MYDFLRSIVICIEEPNLCDIIKKAKQLIFIKTCEIDTELYLTFLKALEVEYESLSEEIAQDIEETWLDNISDKSSFPNNSKDLIIPLCTEIENRLYDLVKNKMLLKSLPVSTKYSYSQSLPTTLFKFTNIEEPLEFWKGLEDKFVPLVDSLTPAKTNPTKVSFGNSDVNAYRFAIQECNESDSVSNSFWESNKKFGEYYKFYQESLIAFPSCVQCGRNFTYLGYIKNVCRGNMSFSTLNDLTIIRNF
uniref:Dimer_Tnp_hAT domain-containing protein n=1 Tax=Rhabditophanes sp. KR3021 TaxID=114890 RepID=A0AC35TFW4_9BILA